MCYLLSWYLMIRCQNFIFKQLKLLTPGDFAHSGYFRVNPEFSVLRSWFTIANSCSWENINSNWQEQVVSFKACFQWHVDYLLGEMCSCDQKMILICWWVCSTATNMKHTPRYLFNQPHLWTAILSADRFYNRILLVFLLYSFFIPNVCCVVRSVFCGRWGNPGLTQVYICLSW